MSPEAAEALRGQIVPRLKSAIARCVRTVGVEDHSQFQWLRLNFEANLMEHMGEQILDESVQAASWRGDLSERVACLADRRRR